MAYNSCVKDIVLTNMGLIKKDDEILVLDRQKDDWPGLTFPGGKVDDDEDIYHSVIREMKEETGLDMIAPRCVGYIEWNIDDVRHLCILFESEKYKGELCSSNEGEVFFIKTSDIGKYHLSQDMDKILDLYGIKWGGKDDKR